MFDRMFLGGFLISCAVTAGCDGSPAQPNDLWVNSAVSPNAGSMLGATRVAVTGHGFESGVTVLFGDAPALVKELSINKLTVETPAHLPGLVNIVVTNPSGSPQALVGSYTYELDPPFTVSGVVTELTADGEMPVAGVEVWESGTDMSVQTDARGAYRLGGLRRSPFCISMSKAGYVTTKTKVTSTSDMQLDLRIERNPIFVLSGMVYESTPGGRVPLDGVLLYCDACGSPDGHTYVTTDANGLYSFEWTRPGKNWIQFAIKDGYTYVGPTELNGIPVNVTGNTRFDIELVKR